jgi:hypothetical protein
MDARQRHSGMTAEQLQTICEWREESNVTNKAGRKVKNIRVSRPSAIKTFTADPFRLSVGSSLPAGHPAPHSHP